MALNCKECEFPLKMGKPIWMFKGKSYHPECVKDNKELYTQWTGERNDNL